MSSANRGTSTSWSTASKRNASIALAAVVFWGTIQFLSPSKPFSSSSNATAASASANAAAAQATVAGETHGSAVRSRHVSYELAAQQSFGFFDDISDVNWQRYQHRARTEPFYTDPNFVNPEPENRANAAKWLLENVDPIFTCPQLRRVGGRGDGSKWVCDPYRFMNQPGPCLIYSIGCGGKYRFEDGMVAELNGTHCEQHVFDPAPHYERPGDAKNKNIHYHAWGLKADADTSVGTGTAGAGEYYTLAQIMAKLGHTGQTIQIFKIDCEECEHTSYVDWLNPAIDIRQILVELHSLPRNIKASTWFDAFLARGFVLFSKEANTHPDVQQKGQLFELAFLRLHLDFLAGRPKGGF